MLLEWAPAWTSRAMLMFVFCSSPRHSEIHLKYNAEASCFKSLLILLFFPFYILFQPPMTALARKLRPRRFLSAIVIAWGLVIVGHGLVQSWRSMLALRCLLGIFEAGFFSSCVHLLSSWYIRGSGPPWNQKCNLLLTSSSHQPRSQNEMLLSISLGLLLQASAVSWHTV